MTFKVSHQPNIGGARSPFQVVEAETGRGVEWVNHFLDRECVRCLAHTTLRSYALDLLHGKMTVASAAAVPDKTAAATATK